MPINRDCCSADVTVVIVRDGSPVWYGTVADYEIKVTNPVGRIDWKTIADPTGTVTVTINQPVRFRDHLDLQLIVPPPPKVAVDESRARRTRHVRWEAWSNQFHRPGHAVFKPVFHQRVASASRPPHQHQRHRRARLCSSPARMMPY